MNTQHYTRPIATELNVVSRIDAAYRAAGVTPPSRADEITALLDDEPTATTVARELSQESLSATDPEAFVADAIERVARAQAVDLLRSQLGANRQETQRRNAPEMIADATRDLSGYFTKTADALTKAARALPEDPLNMEAVVEADATKAMKVAHKALSDLAALAGVHYAHNNSDAPQQARALLAVVDVPEVPVELIDPLTRLHTLNPDDTRDTVRRFCRDARDHGEDRVLVGIARGEYDGLTLSYAVTPTELSARGRRLADAMLRRVDTQGRHVRVLA